MNEFLILFVLILLSGFFSGVETALMSLNSAKVKALLKQEKKGAYVLSRIKENPRRLIITILIGNNLVNIGGASYATYVFTNLFGSSGVGIATGVMTFLILVFGEITPKTFATQNAERISLFVARPIELLGKILFPFVKTFEYISYIMAKILGTKEEKQISEEELGTLVTMGKREGVLTKEMAEMMHNVLRFKGKKVTEIMTPNVNMSVVDGDSALKNVVDFVVKEPYSRFPIFKDDEDKIIGVLDVDDVLKYLKNQKLDVKVAELAKDVLFVPEYKEIDDLLTEFEGEDLPIAVVVDEYGEVSGLVTIEDILEEIVGDIFDKSQRESVYVDRVNRKTTIVDASIPFHEANRTLKLELPHGNFNTLAGFIQHKLERMPKKGEVIKLKKVTITIEKVTKQQIKSVKIIKAA